MSKMNLSESVKKSMKDYIHLTKHGVEKMGISEILKAISAYDGICGKKLSYGQFVHDMPKIQRGRS